MMLALLKKRVRGSSPKLNNDNTDAVMSPIFGDSQLYSQPASDITANKDCAVPTLVVASLQFPSSSSTTIVRTTAASTTTVTTRSSRRLRKSGSDKRHGGGDKLVSLRPVSASRRTAYDDPSSSLLLPVAAGFSVVVNNNASPNATMTTDATVAGSRRKKRRLLDLRENVTTISEDIDTTVPQQQLVTKAAVAVPGTTSMSATLSTEIPVPADVLSAQIIACMNGNRRP